MSTRLSTEFELAALLAEVHNAVLEKKAEATDTPSPHQNNLFAAIPTHLLVCLHELSPKVTMAAVKLLDSGVQVEALVHADVVAFVVGEHVGLVSGVGLGENDTLVPVRAIPMRNSCYCAAFTFGNEELCKHIVAAGLAAMVGAVRVRRVDSQTLAARINANASEIS